MFRREKWSEEEDDYLREFHAQGVTQKPNPNFWEHIALQMQNAGYYKTPKQCRERWGQHLDPTLSTQKWTADDNRQLLSLQARHGNKWKDIALHFPHRTDNGVKNQFFSLVRKSIRRAFKASEVQFSSGLINNVKPKVLSEFLDLQLTGAADATKKGGAPTVRVLIEKFAFTKMSEMAGKVSPAEKELVREVLRQLNRMKWPKQRGLRRQPPPQKNQKGKPQKAVRAGRGERVRVEDTGVGVGGGVGRARRAGGSGGGRPTVPERPQLPDQGGEVAPRQRTASSLRKILEIVLEDGDRGRADADRPDAHHQEGTERPPL